MPALVVSLNSERDMVGEVGAAGQMVHRHQLDRLAADEAHAVEHAAVQEEAC